MSKIFLLASFHLLLAVLLPATARAECPDLWVGIGSSCYKASTDPMDWYQAQEYCGREGGYLIEIMDETEQASLYSFLSTDLYYWIGLTDLAEEGTFVWQESLEGAVYTAWAPGQPLDYEGKEDCVELFDDFLWNDYECGKSSDNNSGRGVHALCETENK